MVFQHIELQCQNQVDSAAMGIETIRGYCGFLLTGLSKFFAFPHNSIKYGVSFSADETSLISCISSPYGDARGRLTIHIADGVLGGRYVFEKSVISGEGKEIWTPIWAIRILKNGNVLLGDEGNIEIEVADPGHFSNAISAPARSLLYCIASTPVFPS